jgi:hypothetical protein
MPHVPGLRSCYAKVGRFIYFGRMLDKIRLHAEAKLPADYVSLLGDTQYYTLDGRCCRFLGVPYAEIKERTLQGGSDEDILAWVHAGAPCAVMRSATCGTASSPSSAGAMNAPICYHSEFKTADSQASPSRPSSTTLSMMKAVTR